MENQNDLLVGIGVDDVAQNHLISIAKWNRFLAITGIVGFGLFILIMLFGGSYLATVLSSMGRQNRMADSYGSGMLTGVFVMYAIIGVVLLIPCVYRLYFANKMLKALAVNDQQLFNDSLANLKIYSQYMGILTIIFIGIYALIIVFLLVAVMAR